MCYSRNRMCTVHLIWTFIHSNYIGSRSFPIRDGGWSSYLWSSLASQAKKQWISCTAVWQPCHPMSRCNAPGGVSACQTWLHVIQTSETDVCCQWDLEQHDSSFVMFLCHFLAHRNGGIFLPKSLSFPGVQHPHHRFTQFFVTRILKEQFRT